ncbi:MAG: dephospho-CoA kinase [Oscillospiraceae bacterium]|nr:dephospho-CoA kinase [Oscillospiraceae bacterium]
MGKIKIIGLTGQTGAGKSTVCDLLRKQGHHVIDCDLAARAVTEKGGRCLADIAAAFGGDILNADGTLNRAKLGKIVFSDSAEKKRLEQIIFPYITEKIFAEIERLRESGAEAVFLDAPTLIESRLYKSCDTVISVTAPQETRFRRIVLRDGLDEDAARRRMSAQHSDDFYTSASDIVIENSGDEPEIGELLRELRIEKPDAP